MKRYYSGKESRGFWDKINKIDIDELHDMAIELQVLEEKVLNEIDKIEKIREPLFVTEDGKELFDKNDNVWPVKKSTFELIPEIDISSQLNTYSFVFFSTKEAAEKWIEENKPIYSKKRIRDTINTSIVSSANKGLIYSDSLKEQLDL
jgi:hypothetical protein